MGLEDRTTSTTVEVNGFHPGLPAIGWPCHPAHDVTFGPPLATSSRVERRVERTRAIGASTDAPIEIRTDNEEQPCPAPR
jgi:hypothetical protein